MTVSQSFFSLQEGNGQKAAPGWTALSGLLSFTLSVCAGGARVVYAPVNQITFHRMSVKSEIALRLVWEG